VQMEDDIRDFELGVEPYEKGKADSIAIFRRQMRALRSSEFAEWKKDIQPLGPKTDKPQSP
jgi:hypothetical protein